MPVARRRLLVLAMAGLPNAVAAQPGPPPAAMSTGRTALLVVDAQVGVLSGVWDAPRVTDRLGVLVARARQAQVPVLWVQHADDELKAGSDAWQLMPGFVPAAQETIIHKHHNSSFADTDLDQRLRALGIQRLVLAGAATNWCIRATAYAAVDRGYHLVLAGDAHSTEPLHLPDGTVVPAQAIVNDLNTVFQWLSAPGVKTAVQPAAEIVFQP